MQRSLELSHACRLDFNVAVWRSAAQQLASPPTCCSAWGMPSARALGHSNGTARIASELQGGKQQSHEQA